MKGIKAPKSHLFLANWPGVCGGSGWIQCPERLETVIWGVLHVLGPLAPHPTQGLYNPWPWGEGNGQRAGGRGSFDHRWSSTASVCSAEPGRCLIRDHKSSNLHATPKPRPAAGDTEDFASTPPTCQRGPTTAVLVPK